MQSNEWPVQKISFDSLADEVSRSLRATFFFVVAVVACLTFSFVSLVSKHCSQMSMSSQVWHLKRGPQIGSA